MADVASAADAAAHWPTGPTSAAVAELVRTLEVTIDRRLDGVLHGNHQGITPGHGSEPGESRLYQPGDDVRRIDWSVSARTQQTYVREQIADRDLEAWLIIDASAAMRFGTTTSQKSQIALGAAAAVGFLTARSQNRLGAVIVAGPHLRVVPPRAGKIQVQAILTATATAPDAEGEGSAALAEAFDRVGVLSKRRGFVAAISDFHGTGWHDSMARLGLRHDLLAITVGDPRELDVPPIGFVEFVDPSTGAAREVRVTPAVQRRFAERAATRRDETTASLRRAGADHIALSTDSDWLGAIVQHVRRRRVQAVHGGVIRR